MNFTSNIRWFRPPAETGWFLTWTIFTMIMVLNFNNMAWAQLSPGPLSRPHAHLEGLKKCSNCHKLGSRQVGEKCLECHQEIAAMRRGGSGLHAGDDFGDCVTCHVEHQGEDFELIYWPQGTEGFDHRTAGFELTGRHQDLGCRKCHYAKYVVDASALKAKNKNLGRTYLGLDPACISCHEDVHRPAGQATAAVKACTDCHDTARWKPAPLFVHDKTAFPLTGKHKVVDCAKCHVPSTDNGKDLSALVFAALPHATCTDCHKDPHAGALGPDCRQCHTTEGWLVIKGDSFDHSRTRYPLLGLHAKVTCAGCHSRNRKKPDFTACNSCHGDAHDSAGLARPRLGRCEDCHTVDGFRPAEYSLAKHAETAFGLRGAHRATPCNACHKPRGAGLDPKAAELVPAHGACTDCHQDPHRGQTGKYLADRGCAACHTEDSWRVVSFDHEPTGFNLEGRHAGTACLSCHPRSEAEVPFAGAARHCAGCHEDVHRGQFADKVTADGQAVACDHCHVTVDWLAEKFNHDRDSVFALKGGHERVACTVCHRPLQDGNDRLLHFKPLPTACKDCHVHVPGPGGDNR
ncbi:MAG: hypothetical protein ABFS42_07240 [Candidatus Krumholzibacteriota bacterium]